MPVVVLNPLVLVGVLLTLATRVMELAGSARRYRKKCQLLQDRVRLISNHLREQQQQQGTSEWESSSATQDTMKCLQEVLLHAQGLVQSCQRQKKMMDFLRAHKKTSEFEFVGKRITNIMESFHMANRSLIQGLYGDRIFMVLLKTLLQDDQGISVLQNNRSRLEICMSGFTYSNNDMSPEKKEILNFIEKALGSAWLQRYAAKPARYNEEVQQVANIAKDIVLKVEAESHSKAEVQRVAQLAGQVIYFLPHLQTPQLAQHPETAGLLRRLLLDLEDAQEVIFFGGGPLQCGGRGAAVMTGRSGFSSEQGKKLCRIGNSVEQGFQRLSFIAMHQIYNNNAKLA